MAVWVLRLLCTVFLMAAGASAQNIRGVVSTVDERDCGKCHEDIVFTFNNRSGSHRELCCECHKGHPPQDHRIVPQCSDCHNDGREHFQLDGCKGCHVNPHAPLEIRLSHKITQPCLSCHQKQIEELVEYPSIHSVLACTACHNHHGQLQPCINCHLPHSDTMDDGSCRVCHKAHMPKEVTYDNSVLSEDCGVCHLRVYRDMVETTSRHRYLSCTACHPSRHGNIPSCDNCHGQPHPLRIHQRFNRCGTCHGAAHRLEATRAAENVFGRLED